MSAINALTLSGVTRTATWLTLLGGVPAGGHEILPIQVLGDYAEICEVQGLPRQLVEAFAWDQLCPGLAEPSAPFNSTCLMNEGNPCKRLIVAGTADGVWFVHYESGGISHSEHLLVLRATDDGDLTEWAYIQPGGAISIGALSATLDVGGRCGGTWDYEYHETVQLGLCAPAARSLNDSRLLDAQGRGKEPG